MKIVSLILSLAFLFFTTPGYATNDVSLELPPESLEKWYKPSNKRQVWLHTMFKLRREMQAIHEYSKAGDFDSIEKWLNRLDKDYNKIADMVPEWKNRIKPTLITKLKTSVQQRDTLKINKTLNSIRRTCKNCHDDFQPLTTALYRTPDYDDIVIIDDKGIKQNLDKNMTDLSRSVNRILISLDDNEKTTALEARDHLASQLQSLGKSCNHCHKDDPYPEQRILGKTTQQHLVTLKTHIQNNRIKDSKQLMGKIAVTVCARCHNTHRTLYELRNALLPKH